MRISVVSQTLQVITKRSGGLIPAGGIFFEGAGADSSDDQIRAIAPKHPAFEVLPVG